MTLLDVAMAKQWAVSLGFLFRYDKIIHTLQKYDNFYLIKCL